MVFRCDGVLNIASKRIFDSYRCIVTSFPVATLELGRISFRGNVPMTRSVEREMNKVMIQGMT